MKLPILIISGFLGAGKTTCIKNLLKSINPKKKVLLIENDFGEVNVDSAIFDKSKIEIRELTSGCICCNLAGDFSSELRSIVNTYDIDLIIIEPSGVGKLSEIKASCQKGILNDLLEVINTVTIVDATRAMLYINNFGEFFKDQVQEASLILLSHNDLPNENINSTIAKLREFNSCAPIINDDWSTLDFPKLFNLEQNIKLNETCCQHTQEDTACQCSCHVKNNVSHNFITEHENHNHAHEDILSTFTLNLSQSISQKSLENILDYVNNNATLVRAKGFVKIKDDFSPERVYLLQYISNNLDLTLQTHAPEQFSITFIGKDINNINWEKVKVLSL